MFVSPAAPTTVLFDLDDTLFDHTATARAALAAALAERPELPELQTGNFESLYRRHSDLLEELHPQVLAGRYTPEAARCLRFRQLLAPHGAVAKPDPRIYRLALERLCGRPAEAVMMGDNWAADVVGALGVGIRPLWLNRFARRRVLAQVAEIAGLAPLAPVLAKIQGPG